MNTKLFLSACSVIFTGSVCCFAQSRLNENFKTLDNIQKLNGVVECRGNSLFLDNQNSMKKPFANAGAFFPRHSFEMPKIDSGKYLQWDVEIRSIINPENPMPGGSLRISIAPHAMIRNSYDFQGMPNSVIICLEGADAETCYLRFAYKNYSGLGIGNVVCSTTIKKKDFPVKICYRFHREGYRIVVNGNKLNRKGYWTLNAWQWDEPLHTGIYLLSHNHLTSTIKSFSIQEKTGELE